MASRFLVFSFFGVVLARSFFPHFSIMDSKAVQRSALCRSRRELFNAYFLAKFGFDTAENEPCQVCPIERSPRGPCIGAVPERLRCVRFAHRRTARCAICCWIFEKYQHDANSMNASKICLPHVCCRQMRMKWQII